MTKVFDHMLETAEKFIDFLDDGNQNWQTLSEYYRMHPAENYGEDIKMFAEIEKLVPEIVEEELDYYCTNMEE